MSFRSARLAGFAAVVLAAASFAASGAFAADLFQVATPVELARSTPAAKERGVVRERALSVNAAAISEGAIAKELTIGLFPGLSPTFAETGSEPAYGGGTIWSGEDKDGGTATLVIVDGQIMGRVVSKGRIYRIKAEGGAVHRIAELSIKAMPKDGPHLHPKPSDAAGLTQAPAAGEGESGVEAEGQAAEAKGTTVVTALFAYTKAARRASKNILSEINLAVALTNQAYRASKIKTSLKLVGTIAVRSSYKESSVSYLQTLHNLTFTDQSGSAAFAATRKKRDAVGADLVVLIREGGDYCGQAWVIAEPDASTSGYGFSQVSRGCIEGDTTAHETGHNRGLLHDRYVETKASSKVYNYGYVNVSKRVMDIMAYSNKCYDAGVNCEQVNLYSSPKLTVKGKPFGIPQGKKGAADGARRLNETKAGVAAYRSGKASTDAQVAADVAADVAEARAAD